jgi:hypothetical protein
MSFTDQKPTNSNARKPGTMSTELLALLRYRAASRYYDSPQVIDAIARTIAGAVMLNVEPRS